MLRAVVCGALLTAALLSLVVFSACDKPVTNLVIIEYRFLGHFASYNPARSQDPPPPIAPGRYNIYEVVSVSNTDKSPQEFTFSLGKVHVGPQGKGTVLDPETHFVGQDLMRPPMPNGMKIYFQSPVSPLLVPPGQKLELHWKILVWQPDRDADDHLFYKTVKPESVVMSRMQNSEPSDQDKDIKILTEQNMPGRVKNLVNIKYRHLRTFSNYEPGGGLPQPSWPNLHNVYELAGISAEPKEDVNLILWKIHSVSPWLGQEFIIVNPIVSPAAFNPPWPFPMKAHFKDPANTPAFTQFSMGPNWKIVVLCQQCAPPDLNQDDKVLNLTPRLFYDATGMQNVIMTRVPEKEPKTKYINKGFLTLDNLP